MCCSIRSSKLTELKVVLKNLITNANVFGIKPKKSHNIILYHIIILYYIFCMDKPENVALELEASLQEN